LGSPFRNLAAEFTKEGGSAKSIKATSSSLAGSQDERGIGRAAVGNNLDFVDSALRAFVSFVSTS
jgi:hypothetical protein